MFKKILRKYLRDRNYVTSSLIEGQPSSTLSLDRKSEIFFCILDARGDSYTTNKHNIYLNIIYCNNIVSLGL